MSNTNEVTESRHHSWVYNDGWTRGNGFRYHFFNKGKVSSICNSAGRKHLVIIFEEKFRTEQYKVCATCLEMVGKGLTEIKEEHKESLAKIERTRQSLFGHATIKRSRYKIQK